MRFERLTSLISFAFYFNGRFGRSFVRLVCSFAFSFFFRSFFFSFFSFFSDSDEESECC